jgi:hypothetical protein
VALCTLNDFMPHELFFWDRCTNTGDGATEGKQTPGTERRWDDCNVVTLISDPGVIEEITTCDSNTHNRPLLIRCGDNENLTIRDKDLSSEPGANVNTQGNFNCNSPEDNILLVCYGLGVDPEWHEANRTSLEFRPGAIPFDCGDVAINGSGVGDLNECSGSVNFTNGGGTNLTTLTSCDASKKDQIIYATCDAGITINDGGGNLSLATRTDACQDRTQQFVCNGAGGSWVEVADNIYDTPLTVQGDGSEDICLIFDDNGTQRLLCWDESAQQMDLDQPMNLGGKMRVTTAVPRFEFNDSDVGNSESHVAFATNCTGVDPSETCPFLIEITQGGTLVSPAWQLSHDGSAVSMQMNYSATTGGIISYPSTGPFEVNRTWSASVDSTYDLGTTSKRWANLWVDDITTTASVDVGTDLTVGGELDGGIAVLQFHKDATITAASHTISWGNNDNDLERWVQPSAGSIIKLGCRIVGAVPVVTPATTTFHVRVAGSDTLSCTSGTLNQADLDTCTATAARGTHTFSVDDGINIRVAMGAGWDGTSDESACMVVVQYDS